MLVIGVSIYVMGVLIWEMVGVSKAQRQMDQAWEKVETLRVGQAELQRQLAVVTSEEFAEEQIRDELLLAKPGETVVVVPQVAEVGKVEQVEQREENLANWQKWVRLFL